MDNKKHFGRRVCEPFLKNQAIKGNLCLGTCFFKFWFRLSQSALIHLSSTVFTSETDWHKWRWKMTTRPALVLGRSRICVLANRDRLKGCGGFIQKSTFAFILSGDDLGEKTVHLQFGKEDWKVTEGQREGPNEPAQRHQPVFTGASAASYQHLFYSARIRKTKGHKVPIHQQDRAIIMSMRCILIVFPQQTGRGK